MPKELTQADILRKAAFASLEGRALDLRAWSLRQTSPEERCKAQFYLGQWHLLREERANSIEALRNAVKSCPKGFIEYIGALAELKRLAQ